MIENLGLRTLKCNPKLVMITDVLLDDNSVQLALNTNFRL